MSTPVSLPEISVDLNAHFTESGYSLQTRGAIDDFARLGLTLERAVGQRFLFNGGADTTEEGQPAEIVFDGIVVKDPVWGYLAVTDADGLRWRMVDQQ